MGNKIMMDETVLFEIDHLKKEIQNFSERLKKISQVKGFEVKHIDTSFFNFMSKHIIFFKNLYLYNTNINTLIIVLAISIPTPCI